MTRARGTIVVQDIGVALSGFSWKATKIAKRDIEPNVLTPRLTMSKPGSVKDIPPMSATIHTDGYTEKSRSEVSGK